MGSSEDSKKIPILYDAPSSPTQPLLSKPYPSPSIEDHTPGNSTPADDHSSDADQTEFLQITYNHGPRTFKDLPFLILFVLFSLCTFGFGIFAIVNENSNYSNVSSYYYDSTTSSCVKNSSSLTLARNVNYGLFSPFSSSGFSFPGEINVGNGFSLSSSDVLTDSIWTLVITLVLSLLIAWCVLLLLKHYTKYLVYVCLPFFILLPIAVNIYWFVACTISSSCSDTFPLVYRIMALIFVFLIIGVIVWIFVLNWHRIELTILIIGVASDALSQNLALFVALPCLTLGLLVYYVPIVVFLVYARFNGSISASESSGEYYCAWKQDSWVPAYYALAIITMIWSATIILEAKAYVISGTIAQWYFSKDGSTPRRQIRSSLRYAFGPSFGTICLSGLLTGIVRVVRFIVDTARQEAPGMVNVMLHCCVNIFLSAVDHLNKFTINFAAITGESYCTSSKMTYELLRRNLLSAVFVETISTRLLAGIMLVISALYAVAACAIVNWVTSLEVDSYLVAVLDGALLLVILGFFVHVLEKVIDTIYVCYAIDRDRGEVCKQDVHEVYVHLPISRSIRSPLISRTAVNV